MKFFLKSSLFLFLMITTIQSFAQIKKPVSLNHIAVYIFDLKKSTDFYKDIIGLTVIPEPFHDGKHTWFRIGEHSQLHLIQGAQSVTDHDKNSHICFSVPSMDDFIKKLKENNIWFGNWAGDTNKITKRPDGVQQIYFKDPDGYWIEINNDTF
ncbi:MAG: VOC family protein [Bacteroidota bacterium]|nr:VOC family protein [Bacteroidota bacterium]